MTRYRDTGVRGNRRELGPGIGARESAADLRAAAIQQPVFTEQRDSTTHTERPALRLADESIAGEQNESHTVVVRGS